MAVQAQPRHCLAFCVEKLSGNKLSALDPKLLICPPISSIVTKNEPGPGHITLPTLNTALFGLKPVPAQCGFPQLTTWHCSNS